MTATCAGSSIASIPAAARRHNNATHKIPPAIAPIDLFFAGEKHATEYRSFL
jgi:hypothetical protein